MNTLRREFLSVLGLNPFIGSTSSPRAQMNYSHMGQKLVISGCEPRHIQTGVEMEIAKYTFNKKSPSKIEIVKVIPKYVNNGDYDSIKYNPLDLIIYQDLLNGEYGIIELPKYCSYHQSFGFEYKPKEAFNRITKGAVFEKDEIFLDSPAVNDKGDYCYGIQLETAFMSLASVAEDGYLVCDEILPQLSYKTYEYYSVSCGENSFPINKFGDLNNFKAFPDIGEYIGEDSILITLRDYDSLLAPVQQSVYDVMKIDQKFDKSIFISEPGGRVVDIKITTADPSLVDNKNPLEKQLFKYINASNRFHESIVEEYKRIKSRWGDNLKLSKEFHRLIIESMAMIGEPVSKSSDKSDNSRRITKIRKNEPIDHFFIEFIIEHTNIPGEGSKLTDGFGGKGVICAIKKREEMPVDKDGNVAMIVTNGGASIDRMNVGRNIEHVINACSRDLRKEILKIIGLRPEDIKQIPNSKNKKVSIAVSNLYKNNYNLFNNIYDKLMEYYSIVSEKQSGWLKNVTDDIKINHLISILSYNIIVYHPPESNTDKIKLLTDLKNKFTPTYDKVYFNGKVTTDKVLIGPMYYILLEKTGKDWSAVSSAKIQHFGIPAQLSKADKNLEPTRAQPVRTLGESECRIFISYTSPRVMAEMMDRNNNPETHKVVTYNILNADNPTNIPVLVDRNILPFNGAKPIALVNHINSCFGIKLSFGDK